MNKKIGIISSALVTLTTFFFAISMIIDNINLAYFVSIILSWAFVLLIGSYVVEANENQKAIAYGALAFSVIYCTIIDIVYFTQLTTVRNGQLSEELLQILSYQHLGSLMFNLNLFGYGMMAIATFLIAFIINKDNRYNKVLKQLLFWHGIFAISCVLMPIFNVFNSNLEGGDLFGTMALLFWCVYFIPIGILSFLYFWKKDLVH